MSKTKLATFDMIKSLERNISTLARKDRFYSGADPKTTAWQLLDVERCKYKSLIVICFYSVHDPKLIALLRNRLLDLDRCKHKCLVEICFSSDTDPKLLLDQERLNIRVEESLSRHGKTTWRSVIFFSQFQLKKLFILHFIVALLGKNVLLTAKIKNTNLVALEAAESLYHNFGLQLINKNVQIFNWNLTADDKTLIPFVYVGFLQLLRQ